MAPRREDALNVLVPEECLQRGDAVHGEQQHEEDFNGELC